MCKAEIETQCTIVWTSGGEERTELGEGIDIYVLLILRIKYINNEKLLYSTGSPTQCSVVTETGRKFKSEGIYVSMYTHS